MQTSSRRRHIAAFVTDARIDHPLSYLRWDQISLLFHKNIFFPIEVYFICKKVHKNVKVQLDEFLQMYNIYVTTI